ncbi:MAG: beta-galactosidase, partial [Candidatus Latescibacteria bacterium]|nr:beta-galactosidase [Candidatus Latescibacterota bacterium]
WWNPGQKDEKSFGYGKRPRSKEEFLQRYRALTEALLFHPRMCGFCYTQLYDIEQEVNGLYTYDRRPKFDPEKIQAINNQRAAIEEKA